MSPTIDMSDVIVPTVGIPEGEKDAGQRVDAKPSKFELMIENKGYLLAWTRASECPCSPVSAESTQPDPNCSLCAGRGWFYFGSDQDQDLSGYNFSDVQTKIIQDSGAMIIRGTMVNVVRSYDPINKLTNWEEGTMSVTVRHENKLGIYDRLVVLWPEITFSEVVLADGTDILRTRYLATGVSQVRGAVLGSDVVEYRIGTHYELDSQGHLIWYPGEEPVEGTRVSVHYTCHPTFLVTEHPHVIRSTLKAFKQDPATLNTPMGNAAPLPIQAKVQYEFLP